MGRGADYTELRTADGTVFYRDAAGALSWDPPQSEDNPSGSDEWLFVPNEAHGWLPGKRTGGHVMLHNPPAGMAKSVDVPAGATTYPLTESSLTRIVERSDDLVALDDVNDCTICHALRERYVRGDFYTSVGTILIALNPYEYHPIYTDAYSRKYRNPGSNKLAPHVFQLAAAAHSALELGLGDQVRVGTRRRGVPPLPRPFGPRPPDAPPLHPAAPATPPTRPLSLSRPC